MATHGGKRAGAGRKDPRVKERIQFTLSQSTIAKLRKHKNMSEVVEIALLRYLEEKS